MWRKLAKIVPALFLAASLIMGGSGAAGAATNTGAATQQITSKVVALACGGNDICLQKMEMAQHAEHIVISPKIYIVANGDILSAIAPREHTDTESLYCDNRKVIGSDPNIIRAGQKLVIPTSKVKCSGYNLDSSVISSPQTVYNGSGGSGRLAAFQSCVISRESGGRWWVMNSSGHYGLYQFSYSTWVVYGGSGSLFGKAGAAYQTQIFYNAMRDPYSGENNWRPYDGCVY